MRFDIATLFPEMCETVVNSSIIGRGIKAGKLEVHCHQIRDYTTDKHRRTDLRLHGGGMGMLMTCQPIHDCWKAVSEQIGQKPYVIYLSPQGKVLTQAHARELKEKENLFLLCGHYEGVDQRFIDAHVTHEISLGDFVLSGGELPALVLLDAVARLMPGVLSAPSHQQDSFSDGLLDCPHYSRPEVLAGVDGEQPVPAVLLSGHHADIARWRRERSLELTARRRPDLIAAARAAGRLSRQDEAFLAALPLPL